MEPQIKRFPCNQDRNKVPLISEKPHIVSSSRSMASGPVNEALADKASFRLRSILGRGLCISELVSCQRRKLKVPQRGVA